MVEMVPKQKGTKAQQKVCDLCYALLEDGQDVLACNTNVHHYCSGVTRCHYSELTTGTNPIVCKFCALKTYIAFAKQL